MAVVLCQGLYDFFTRGRDGEHAKIMLYGGLMSFDAGRCGTILQGIDLVPLFIGRSHCRFDTTIGQKAT